MWKTVAKSYNLHNSPNQLRNLHCQCVILPRSFQCKGNTMQMRERKHNYVSFTDWKHKEQCVPTISAVLTSILYMGERVKPQTLGCWLFLHSLVLMMLHSIPFHPLHTFPFTSSQQTDNIPWPLNTLSHYWVVFVPHPWEWELKWWWLWSRQVTLKHPNALLLFVGSTILAIYWATHQELCLLFSMYFPFKTQHHLVAVSERCAHS